MQPPKPPAISPPALREPTPLRINVTPLRINVTPLRFNTTRLPTDMARLATDRTRLTTDMARLTARPQVLRETEPPRATVARVQSIVTRLKLAIAGLLSR